MLSHNDKTQENKSQSVANAISNNQGDVQFVDNRPEAVAQRKLQEIANNGTKAKQLVAFQDMANKSPEANIAAHLQETTKNNFTIPSLTSYNNSLAGGAIQRVRFTQLSLALKELINSRKKEFARYLVPGGPNDDNQRLLQGLKGLKDEAAVQAAWDNFAAVPVPAPAVPVPAPAAPVPAPAAPVPAPAAPVPAPAVPAPAAPVPALRPDQQIFATAGIQIPPDSNARNLFHMCKDLKVAKLIAESGIKALSGGERYLQGRKYCCFAPTLTGAVGLGRSSYIFRVIPGRIGNYHFLRWGAGGNPAGTEVRCFSGIAAADLEVLDGGSWVDTTTFLRNHPDNSK